jgi:membrane protease YdiL (CAAX protease family)
LAWILADQGCIKAWIDENFAWEERTLPRAEEVDTFGEAARRPQVMKAWGLAATLGFGVLAVGLGWAMAAATLAALRTAGVQSVDHGGTATVVLTLVAIPIQTITLVLAARMTDADALDYFALRMPHWRNASIAIAVLAAVIVLGDVLTVALGRDLVPSSALDLSRSAQQDGTLLLLLLALIVVGPVGEEVLFRGFLFRGLIQEPRDSLPGILAIALIWSVLHLQYDWFDASLIFAFGVIFGYARLYSGSTLLAIFLHMLVNCESLAESAIALGWI